MSYIALIVAVAGLWLSAASHVAAQTLDAAARPQTTIGSTVHAAPDAQVTGKVINPGGSPIPNVTVRARDLLTGRIGTSTSTASAGQFSLNVSPGNYILEAVDTEGQIIGTSSFISAAAGSAIPTVTVTTTASVLTGLTTAASLSSVLGTTAARSVTYAAAAAGVAGVVTPAAVPTASPSR